MSSENIEKVSVQDILQRIRDGLLNSRSLSKQSRQACVEVLAFDGWLLSSIAKFFKVSDRTICRDFEDIRKKIAVEATPELTKILIGELITNARGHWSRLRQLSHSADISAIDKAKVEYLCFRVTKELVETLDSVGYFMVQKVFLELDKNPKNEQGLDKEIIKEIASMVPIDRDMFIDKLTAKIEKLEELENQQDSKNK
jgi:hypothetical protein